MEGSVVSMPKQSYHVTVYRSDADHAIATTRTFQLTPGVRRADPTAGFNPVETLLVALGSCLLTALTAVADLSRVPMDSASIALTATRQDQPLQLVGITYQLVVQTPVSADRLDRLIELAKKNSTVYQTLRQALPIEGTWEQGTCAEVSSNKA